MPVVRARYFDERGRVSEQEEWTPEFEGQRPPFQPGNEVGRHFEPGNEVGRQFEPGNEVSLRHGAWSPRKVDPLAKELVDAVLEDPATSYLQAAHWRPAVWAWAQAEAQVQLLTEWLATKGEATGDGVGDLKDEGVSRAYILLHRAAARATTGRTRLGLDPLSAARLGRDRNAAAVDMAKLMQLAAEEDERQREGDDDQG